MKYVNQEIKNKATDFETRVYDAVFINDDKSIKLLMDEAKLLYENEMLTPQDFNIFQSLELIKEIYS
jgi:hypothetical protein